MTRSGRLETLTTMVETGVLPLFYSAARVAHRVPAMESDP